MSAEAIRGGLWWAQSFATIITALVFIVGGWGEFSSDSLYADRWLGLGMVLVGLLIGSIRFTGRVR